ncbi:MAG: nuclear transport factor 2 family protein [Actinomycetota bacterium]|nr:nuclear transport factor 2 family protein [Actinomycetota bacterium]MDQ3901536.1 nuclear transport factor 2 family protein [Actinomycetota bacterium]
MATMYLANERGAIENAVRLYIDGVSEGDADKLKTGFHSEAWMFGSVGGQRYDIPISQLIEMATSQPFDSAGNYKARITSIQQVDDAAIAIVEEDGIWGSMSCVDFFALAKIDGSWKIVNKTFAHSGGEMPAG